MNVLKFNHRKTTATARNVFRKRFCYYKAVSPNNVLLNVFAYSALVGRCYHRCVGLKGPTDDSVALHGFEADNRLPAHIELLRSKFYIDRSVRYIDKDRIAIWGWSFGGYNTLMALSAGNGTFKVGIAVAPPTDWKYYDSVYTERFMRTPQENFEGYAATSPLRRVKDLQGKLLLVHGTADDNVHFMQTMEYAEALVQANKQFDMHVYKDRNHSIYGGNTRYHLYTKMANYLFNNL